MSNEAELVELESNTWLKANVPCVSLIISCTCMLVAETAIAEYVYNLIVEECVTNVRINLESVS